MNPLQTLTAAQIAGCATDAQKETVILWFQLVSQGFSGSIVERIKPIRYDVVLADSTTSTGPSVADASVRGKGATLVCDLTIEDDMLNGYKSLHGGAAAFLADVCTSFALAALSGSNGNVSVNLNLDYHQPVPVGTTIEIISTTQAVGKRLLSTRCEFRHKEKRTLLISGSHTKMSPSKAVYDTTSKL